MKGAAMHEVFSDLVTQLEHDQEGSEAMHKDVEEMKFLAVFENIVVILFDTEE